MPLGGSSLFYWWWFLFFIGIFESVSYSILETNDLVESLGLSMTIGIIGVIGVIGIIILRTTESYRIGCAHTE